MQRRFNIMHLVLDLDIGGLQFMVINLLKRFNMNDITACVTCILNGGRLVQEAKNLGAHVEIIHKPDKLDFSASFKIAKILKERKIELIHTHNTAAYLYGSSAARLAGKVKIVHTEHGKDFPDKKRRMIADQENV